MMKWEVEKEDMIQLLTSWIENTSESVRLGKRLRQMIRRSSSKDKFIEGAQGALQEYPDPWIQEELESILDIVV